MLNKAFNSPYLHLKRPSVERTAPAVYLKEEKTMKITSTIRRKSCLPGLFGPGLLVSMLFFLIAQTARAADLTVKIDGPGANQVNYVGAFDRWDMDGNPKKEVNGKAKIETPETTVSAQKGPGGTWVFKNIPAGTYDLVVMTGDKKRFEGWHYPPVLEFDPFFAPDATCKKETGDWIDNDIRNSKHYENKVEPLYMGGDDRAIRVLVMLIRDLKTSYEGEMPGAATMRFEVWQYDYKYGGWEKNKRTRVMHRVLTTRDNLRSWTWLWSPDLGQVEMGKTNKTVNFTIPSNLGDTEKLRGLRPY